MLIEKKSGNPTDHLANERTFLAWISTSIAIMAFGFRSLTLSVFMNIAHYFNWDATCHLSYTEYMTKIGGN